MSIAVTGATGGLGGRIARELSSRGVEQRLVVRDSLSAPRLPGADVAVAAYEDSEAMAKALEGIGTLLLVSGPEDPDRISLHRKAVEGARLAGVERIVYTSFMGASPSATFPFARDHCATELAIREAGISLTAMRNSLYADVAPQLVGADGVIRGPGGHGRLAWVARADVARLAAVLLVEPGHEGQIYDVSGPHAIDLHETARILTKATRRAITYHAETPNEARASREGHPGWLVDGWIGSYTMLETGEGSVTSHTIEHFTGQRPMTLPEFLAAEPASFAHLLG
ncbi:MAG TPA: SDR family oxidoreductase [Dermatophilaceae bacterium]